MNQKQNQFQRRITKIFSRGAIERKILFRRKKSQSKRRLKCFLEKDNAGDDHRKNKYRCREGQRYVYFAQPNPRGLFLCLCKPLFDTRWRDWRPAATGRAANAASPPSTIFHRFISDLTLNFAVLKPLDFIGFAGPPFLKNAPTIDFYSFGGYILVRGITARQIAELCFIDPTVNRPKVPPPPSARRA